MPIIKHFWPLVFDLISAPKIQKSIHIQFITLTISKHAHPISEQAKQLVEQIKQLQKDTKYNECLPLYDQILTEYPNNVQILLSKAKTQTVLKAFEDALNTINKAASLRPESEEVKSHPNRTFTLQVQYLRGTILHSLGRSDEALDGWKPLLAKDQSSTETLLRYVMFLGSIGKEAIALDAINNFGGKLELELGMQKGEKFQGNFLSC
jgi:tetratricopeptide (TPR) repeat protein